MEIWGTLLGTTIGAAIAIVGQHLVKRAEGRTRLSELLFEQCALVAVSAADYDSRIWEERVLGLEDRVSGFDLAAHRLASVRLKLLSQDRELLDAVEELNKAGSHLGDYWRRGDVGDDEFTRRWDRHRAAREKFLAVSVGVVGRSLRRG
ncbi:hypothetical protein ACFQ6U_34705 [Streptomyces sp. NPDC056465]|uniref:hypothetical protein n=1 Tax=unclassified Streptomyces TaxID=2593676 RepID=UPI00368788CC